MSQWTWITDGSDHPFYARKQFELKAQPVSAEAKVCGLGQFIFRINGKKVGDHELDPGWTDYRKLIQYVRFDVTDDLLTGSNVLGVEVGNGWFLKNDEHYTFTLPAFMPPNPNPYQPFGKSLVLALELTLRYADGTEETICTDDGFRVCPHPVTQSNVYGSETIDHRLMQPGWAEPGFDDSSWCPAIPVPKDDAPSGHLEEQFQPPIKRIKNYPARYLHAANGRAIYDLGQNMSGILSLEAKGRCGDVIRIYPAEKLRSDGDVDQVAKNWVTVNSVMTCILGTDDLWESFEMCFTYFAGRFVAVECPQSVTLRGLEADAITSAWKRDGSFHCDDERYNKIYDMIERTVEANMVSVHTDCPTIERFAWQEPNHLMAPSIFFMKDGKALWEKFLLDMRTAQHTKEDFFFDYEGQKVYPGDGLVPSQAPCYIPNVLPVPGMGSFYDIIAWGSSIILATRWHYLFYGDLKVVEDNYEAGLRYLEHLKTKLTPEGFINHGLGDWGNPRGTYARENIETAFLYADAVTLAWFARLLDRPEDQEQLGIFADEVRRNYNKRLLTKDAEGRWYYRDQETDGMTQACQALPLYWGMVPEKCVDDVVQCLRSLLETDGALIAGEIGLPYVIQAAAAHGMNDLIASCILRKDHPSYYAFVLDGETTLGEFWENNPRSHCHDMMGHIIEWYYTAIAGIENMEPGFGRIRLRPWLPASIHNFSCDYHSASGTIEISVQETEDTVLLSCSVPEDMICEILTDRLEQRGKHVQVERKDR